MIADATRRRLDEAQSAFRRGDVPRAEALLQRVVASEPALAGAWYHLGVALDALGRYEEAVEAYGRSLALDERQSGTWVNRGAALHDLQRFDEALTDYDRALALNPGDATAWRNRGVALRDLGRHDDAIESYDRALALNARDALAWTFRGGANHELRRHEEALADCARALAIDPELAEAHWNEAHACLALGQFEAGWTKFEYRWKRRGAPRPRHAHLPLWLGREDLSGRRVLVWAEQGLGDTLQFCRYAPLLAERGAEVVVEVPAVLVSLLASLPGCTVVALGEALPACDFQVPMMSLPLAFGTTLATVPARTPYLHADAERVRHWAGRLPRAGKPLVGIACSGNAFNPGDRLRNVPLREFAVLGEAGTLCLVQKGHRDDDAAYLREAGAAIVDLGEALGDFGEAAAVVANLDHVVSVDTALAHLAGALGRPVSILLPWSAEFRWLDSGDKSPWYPSATLFRQARPGAWGEAMARVKEHRACC